MTDPFLTPEMQERCLYCGFARWYHRAKHDEQSCPAHAGRMDWLIGCVFKPSGKLLRERDVHEQRGHCWGTYRPHPERCGGKPGRPATVPGNPAVHPCWGCPDCEQHETQEVQR